MSLTRNTAPLYRLSAPNDPSSPRVCRDAIAALLRAKGEQTLVDTARLLVSEAVTNVHRHATSTRMIHIDVFVQNGAAWIAVKDNEPKERPLHPRPMDPEGEGGRGLLLMDQLAHAWGVSNPGNQDPNRKQVWFEVRAPGAVRPSL